jgi:hypothetical protein
MASATAVETMGRPQREHRGSRSARVSSARQARQNGRRLPVSSGSAQIRQGAGKTTEASAWRIPRRRDRHESATEPTVALDYTDKGWKRSEIVTIRD